MPMKKIITGIVAVLAISSFSVAVPAQATTDSAPTQNAVNTQPKAHVKGIIDGLCTLYPDWCFNLSRAYAQCMGCLTRGERI